MSTGQWVGVVAGVVTLFAQSAGPAHAGGMFGASESVRKIQPTGDPQYDLCYKVRYYFFVLGCYVADDGYVLQAAGDKDRYIPLTRETVARLQKEGALPTPLPPYSLPFWDYLLGYSNWILLGIVGVSSLVRRTRQGPEPPPPAGKRATRGARQAVRRNRGRSERVVPEEMPGVR